MNWIVNLFRRKRYFVISPTPLTEEQFKRLKDQMTQAWNESNDKPILLEGVQVIRL